MHYYNENDPDAAAWLLGLIKERLIPYGIVDTRSITEVEAHEIKNFTQCHFFAGIGGWPLALQIAGWPEDWKVWTGSCPCQPFSTAGKGKGVEDERHLWPVFANLIEKCRPPVVFGEQVASKAGRTWWTGVSADLERMGYAAVPADICAAGVGAPHIRQRLFWVGDTDDEGSQGHHWHANYRSKPGRDDEESSRSTGKTGRTSERVAYNEGVGRNKWCTESSGSNQRGGKKGLEQRFGGSGFLNSRMADVSGGRFEQERKDHEETGENQSSRNGFWDDSAFLECEDGKFRRVPVEPSLFPLADGLPYKLARRGSIRPALLKGAGNAIVPEVAAEFIGAYMDVRSQEPST